MIQEAINILSQNKDLNPEQMQLVMEEIMNARADTAAIVSFLNALSNKGETVEELTAAVRVLREHAIKIHIEEKVILDTCGTGADKTGTFNVSTAVAFVVSACQITVAKHGNRSVSSCCGSADVLEELGVNINLSVERIQKCLNDIGIAFLFAQSLHPAMKNVMPARKQIGKKTIFNILGPLSNPAGATHQLVGVYDNRWTEVLAKVLGNLGTVHSLVVHGEDGLDEITTTSSTYIAETNKGKITSYKIVPEEFGFTRARLEDLKGGDVKDNAKLLSDVLSGKGGPRRDIVLLNAGAAVYTADRANSIREGIELAKEAIDSKKALQKLELLKRYSLN